MKPIALIKSWVLRHKETGKAISPYGCLPYGEYKDWERVDRGWTTRNDNGTVGYGRQPFKTLEEAKKAFPELPVEGK